MLKKLKGEGVWAILEEKILSIEGLEGKYPNIFEIICYYKFEQFMRHRGPYIHSWVR